MEPRGGLALIDLAFSLLVYPVALAVPLLALIFRKEARETGGLTEILRLMGASSLILFSSSVQVLFSHIDVIQELSGSVRTFLFLLLSQIFWAGLYLFSVFFYRVILSLTGEEERTALVHKILSSLTLAFLTVLLVLFLLSAFPATAVAQKSLPPALILTSVGMLGLMGHALLTAFGKRRSLAHGRLLGLLVGGDGAFLVIFLLQILYFPVSLFFLLHFVLLFLLFDRIRKAPGDPKGGSITPERLAALGLSPREGEIALALSEGMSYQDAADRFCVSLSTIQTHVRRIYRKLDVKNKTELAGLISRLNSPE